MDAKEGRKTSKFNPRQDIWSLDPDTQSVCQTRKYKDKYTKKNTQRQIHKEKYTKTNTHLWKSFGQDESTSSLWLEAPMLLRS